MKRILVTGACGSVGFALTKKLIDQGNVVCALDNNEDAIFRLKSYFDNTDGKNLMRYFLGDVRDLNRLEQAFQGVSEVYHCAALKHVELCEYNPTEALKTNIEGTQNVIKSAYASNVSKVILASSDKAVNPTSVMGTSKLFCEKLIIAANDMYQSTGVKFSCVRFGNVWNTNGSVGQIFRNQVRNGKNLTLTDPNMTRFFISIDAATQLCVDACDAMIGGEIFVAHMVASSMELIAKEFIEHNHKLRYEVIGTKPGEKLFEELFTETESLRTYNFKGLYVILPPVLRDDIGRHSELLKKYTFGQLPNNKALRSDTCDQSETEIKKMVLDIMHAS